jgi:hypothetical protein
VHGNGTAFSAVAPSERPVLPSIIQYSGVASPRPEWSQNTPIAYPVPPSEGLIYIA